jgi:hypothetical protein
VEAMAAATMIGSTKRMASSRIIMLCHLARRANVEQSQRVPIRDITPKCTDPRYLSYWVQP